MEKVIENIQRANGRARFAKSKPAAEPTPQATFKRRDEECQCGLETSVVRKAAKHRVGIQGAILPDFRRHDYIGQIKGFFMSQNVK